MQSKVVLSLHGENTAHQEAGWKTCADITAKLFLEPPGSVPLVEMYLGRMGWADQAAYLRLIHTLGIDPQWLKKAADGGFQQAIGFIAFSRLPIVWDP